MPDRTLDNTIRIRIDNRGVESRIGKTRRGLDSISAGLERMQRVAAATVLGGGAIEAIRRTAGHAVRLYADIESGLTGVAKTADLSAREVRRLDETLRVPPHPRG